MSLIHIAHLLSPRSLSFPALLIALVIAGCHSDSTGVESETAGTSSIDPESTVDPPPELQPFSRKRRTESEARKSPPIRFSDVAADLNLRFQYDNGASEAHLMTEATGGGVGWLDFDRDGFPDLYFPQGGDPVQPADKSQPGDQLFRNISGEVFVDVSESAAVSEYRFSQGTAVGDYDNDGFDDVFVTNVGPNRLLRNLGDGTFQDVTADTGMTTKLWSTSAAWGDVDRDGDLDLYVCNYADYDPLDPVVCLTADGRPATCHPKEVEAVPDSYFRNDGTGEFKLMSRELQLYGPGNKALGVAIVDTDNDRWPDIFVANDTTANFLFTSNDGQSFHEDATLRGCAVATDGHAQASMGVGVGDFDRNGFLDFYVTHFASDWNTMYVNLGEQGFHDRTSLLGLASPTMRLLAFGTVMADFNNDGWLDLLVANGHVDRATEEGIEYRMPAQIFAWSGRRFDEVSAEAGEYFGQPRLGRGIVTLDFDRDGRLDAAVVNQNEPAALLRNTSPPSNWLAVELIGQQSNRRGIGARIAVTTDGGTQYHELAGGGSYASTVQPVAWFGLGTDALIHSLTILWPAGSEQTVTNVAPNQTLVVVESCNPLQESAVQSP